jgi:hypothetical protein
MMADAPRVVDAPAPRCKVQAEACAAEKEAGGAAEKAGARGGGAAVQLEEEGGQLHERSCCHTPASFHYLPRGGGEGER